MPSVLGKWVAYAHLGRRDAPLLFDRTLSKQLIALGDVPGVSGAR
jgi:hypothetical protein